MTNIVCPNCKYERPSNEFKYKRSSDFELEDGDSIECDCGLSFSLTDEAAAKWNLMIYNKSKIFTKEFFRDYFYNLDKDDCEIFEFIKKWNVVDHFGNSINSGYWRMMRWLPSSVMFKEIFKMHFGFQFSNDKSIVKSIIREVDINSIINEK